VFHRVTRLKLEYRKQYTDNYAGFKASPPQKETKKILT